MGGNGSKPVKYLPAFEGRLPSLEGKTVAITGCTSGTGLQAAKVTARKGVAHLLLLNRSSPRADSAEAEIKAAIPAGAKTTVTTIPCDLQDFESVKAAAATIKKNHKSLDVLCNNAGVMAMDAKTTKDGYDVQMQTNHLSHFLLTKELFPLLKKAQELRGDARIVNHSSMARRGGPLQAATNFGKLSGDGELGGNGTLAKWERYHQSKLANVVFTLALKDKLGSSGIKTACAAPGHCATSLQTTSQGMGGFGWLKFFAQSAEDGAMPLLQCCFGPETVSGDFWEPSKWMHAFGPAGKIEFDLLTKECTNVASRTELWKVSEDACGNFDI